MNIGQVVFVDGKKYKAVSEEVLQLVKTPDGPYPGSASISLTDIWLNGVRLFIVEYTHVVRKALLGLNADGHWVDYNSKTLFKTKEEAIQVMQKNGTKCYMDKTLSGGGVVYLDNIPKEDKVFLEGAFNNNLFYATKISNNTRLYLLKGGVWENLKSGDIVYLSVIFSSSRKQEVEDNMRLAGILEYTDNTVDPPIVVKLEKPNTKKYYLQTKNNNYYVEGSDKLFLSPNGWKTEKFTFNSKEEALETMYKFGIKVYLEDWVEKEIYVWARRL